MGNQPSADSKSVERDNELDYPSEVLLCLIGCGPVADLNL